jgi:hypothetical protein
LEGDYKNNVEQDYLALLICSASSFDSARSFSLNRSLGTSRFVFLRSLEATEIDEPAQQTLDRILPVLPWVRKLRFDSSPSVLIRRASWAAAF